MTRQERIEEQARFIAEQEGRNWLTITGTERCEREDAAERLLVGFGILEQLCAAQSPEEKTNGL